MMELDRSTASYDQYRVRSGTVDCGISGNWGALCTVAGSAHLAAQAGDGVLDVTRGDPVTYLGQGATAVPPEITITCPDRSAKVPYHAAALWFSPSEAGGFPPSAGPTELPGRRGARRSRGGRHPSGS